MELLGVTEQCPVISTIALLVGALCLVRLVLQLLLSLWSGAKAFLLSGMLGVNLKSYGWAVVTGASDGIGKGYALELARQGVNVVLVSRSEEKLQQVEKEILDQYHVMTRIVVADFAGGPGIYDDIRTQLSGLEIGILINNVGASYEFPEYFLNVSDEKNYQLLNINMASMVMMTKMLLPEMVDRGKGVVVNVSSAAALSPTPLLAVYSATKVFMDYFSTAVRYEYRDKGVIIQSVLPFFVATKMSGIRRPSFFAPDARYYARSALATIGIQDKTHGTLAHALQGWIQSLVPSCLLLKGVFHALGEARAAAIRKKQKKR